MMNHRNSDQSNSHMTFNPANGPTGSTNELYAEN